MVFVIFKANLYFNDLCPFFNFMLNIFQKIQLRQKMKYVQILVLYSSQNITLFIKKF